MEKQPMRIGVDRLFYAKVMDDTEDETVYSETEELKGVTEIAVRTGSSAQSFYSDDGLYETAISDGEKYLQINFAGLSNKVVAALTGASYSNASITDKAGDSPPYVAVGFRSQKSNGSYRYVWLMKGRFAKAEAYYTTKTESVSPQSDLYTYFAVQRRSDGAWRRTLDSDDANLPQGVDDSVLNDEESGWFESPDYAPHAV